MSNNKQMKLYTKEDFLKAAEFCEVSMIDAKYIIERIDEVTDPIELPSDEEVEKEAYENIIKQETWDSVEDKSTIFYGAFLMCAKYLRDKIQGGIK